jgi:hypothetical protein
MRRPFSLLRPGLLAFALVAGGLLATASVTGAATIAPTTTCSNGVDNTGGLGLICQVTVVNTITPSGGSSRTTVRECHGAAGDPTAACTTTVRIMSRLVTRVTQCNDSINGGGGTLRCSVKVTNNFVGVSTGRSAATVNQCVGSGDGIANECDPFPANTTGATITQCNGSANGGTLVQLKCTATGTKSTSSSVRINQCNGSANGGGALVICSTNLVNRILPAGSTGGGAAPTVPATNTTDQVVEQQAGTNPLILAAVLLLVGLTLIASLRRFGGTRRLG